MAKNVLITGGSGNLGRYIAAALQENYQVTLFDKMRPDQYIHWGTRSPFTWKTDLPFVLGNLTDLGDLLRAVAFAEADTIIHAGAMSNRTELVRGFGGQQQVVAEDETMRVNTMGTFYVMDAARRLGVERVIMISSLSVTGMHNRISRTPFKVEYLPIDEKHPLRPESTYGLSKLLGEETLEAFARAYGIQTIAFRPSGIYFPHRENVKFGLRPEAAGGGFSPFVYVDARDLAQACALAVEAQGLEPFEAFYVNTDTVLAEETKPVLERLYPELKDMLDGFEGHAQAVSISKAQEKLGYQPSHSWRNQG